MEQGVLISTWGVAHTLHLPFISFCKGCLNKHITVIEQKCYKWNLLGTTGGRDLSPAMHTPDLKQMHVGDQLGWGQGNTRHRYPLPHCSNTGLPENDWRVLLYDSYSLFVNQQTTRHNEEYCSQWELHVFSDASQRISHGKWH